MTEEKLKAGLTDYLYLNQYGNAETADLFDVLDLFGDNLPDDLDVTTIMKTWTELAGYPVVYCDGSSVTQDRFFLNPTSKPYLYSNNHISIFKLQSTFYLSIFMLNAICFQYN